MEPKAKPEPTTIVVATRLPPGLAGRVRQRANHCNQSVSAYIKDLLRLIVGGEA